MKITTTLVCLGLLAGYGQAASAAENSSKLRLSGYSGVYLGDIEVQTINGFDCAQLVEFGFVDGCTARVLVTISWDGTLRMVDTSDYSEGFDSPHAGNWDRRGRRHLSTRTMGFGFDPAGEDTGTQVRTGEWEFAQDRKSFSGSSMTSVYNADTDPLDPAAIAAVTIVATISARRVE